MPEDRPANVDPEEPIEEGDDEEAATEVEQVDLEDEHGEAVPVSDRDDPDLETGTHEPGDVTDHHDEFGEIDDAKAATDESPDEYVPEDVQRYARFTKLDRAEYDRVNQFLRNRTYITAREWAIARLCSDFRTETGIEMTKIGNHLPELVPFMTEEYSPQAVNQARHAFEEKVRKSGSTFLYGAMCDFFTAEELDDVLYEATEVARFLLEVEGVELDLEEEFGAEERIATVMREVRTSSDALRHEGAMCPNCGHEFEPEQTTEE